MYVNLILGAVALAAIWGLLYRLLVKPDAAVKSLDPAAILAQELEERRGREEGSKAAFERMRDSAARQLVPVMDALAAMRTAMPPEQQAMNCLTWNEGGDGVLHVAIRKNEQQKEPRAFFISWRLKDVDLQALASDSKTLPQGYYTMREGMEREETLPDLNAVVRRLAGTIADELA